VTALGLIAFGLFQLVEAAFRRVDTVRRRTSPAVTSAAPSSR
jgi:hypothetical protein